MMESEPGHEAQPHEDDDGTVLNEIELDLRTPEQETDLRAPQPEPEPEPQHVSPVPATLADSSLACSRRARAS